MESIAIFCNPFQSIILFKNTRRRGSRLQKQQRNQLENRDCTTRAEGYTYPAARMVYAKGVSLFHRRIETLGFSLESDDACGSLLPRDYQRDSWKSDQNKWTAKILPFSPVITSPTLPPSPPSSHLESSRLLQQRRCYRPTWIASDSRVSPTEGEDNRA